MSHSHTSLSPELSKPSSQDSLDSEEYVRTPTNHLTVESVLDSYTKYTKDNETQIALLQEFHEDDFLDVFWEAAIAGDFDRIQIILNAIPEKDRKQFVLKPDGDGFGPTACHYAAEKGFYHIVAYLAKINLEVLQVVDENGALPIAVAERGSLTHAILLRLQAGENAHKVFDEIDYLQSAFNRVVDLIVKDVDLDGIRKYLNRFSDAICNKFLVLIDPSTGGGICHFAAAREDVALLKFLIGRFPVSFTKLDREGTSPLSAAGHGHTAEFLKQTNQDIIKQSVAFVESLDEAKKNESPILLANLNFLNVNNSRVHAKPERNHTVQNSLHSTNSANANPQENTELEVDAARTLSTVRS